MKDTFTVLILSILAFFIYWFEVGADRYNNKAQDKAHASATKKKVAELTLNENSVNFYNPNLYEGGAWVNGKVDGQRNY